MRPSKPLWGETPSTQHEVALNKNTGGRILPVTAYAHFGNFKAGQRFARGRACARLLPVSFATSLLFYGYNR
jgi:hypothetical protein